jgi:archaellum component FlaC
MSETTKKAASKVKELTEPVKEFSGLVKENYLNGLDFTFSLLEQNIKAFGAQADHIFDLEKEFVTNLSGFYKDFPKDLPFVKDLPYDGGVKKVSEQVQTVKTMSEKFTKDARAMAQENVEKAFSLLGEYFSHFGA